MSAAPFPISPLSFGLMSGGVLQRGETRLSPSGWFSLAMQDDGNLVIYRLDTSPNKAVWASNTWNTPTKVTRAIMQLNGDLVCSDDYGTAFWASNTGGHPGAFAQLQDDGILVIREPWSPNFTVLWTSKNNNRLLPNQQLNIGDQLRSPNGRFSLVMQGDGNLVLYDLDTTPNTVVWACCTFNLGKVTHAIMQWDGNLLCSDDYGTTIWASNTGGHPGAFAQLRDDGILVVVDPPTPNMRDGTALWASAAALLPYQQLNIGNQLLSRNGRFSLVMQGDGNLVIYDLDTTPNKAVWACCTWNLNKVTVAVMQWDGNLVCYDAGGTAIWSSNTWDHPGAFAVLRDDGKLVVAEVTGAGLWASDLCIPNVPWQNYHRNLPPETPAFTCVPATIDDIVTIVVKAETEGRKVHARGSGWSFSDCTVTDDYVIATAQLNRELQTVQRALIDGAPLVYHVEAGITIRDLYLRLDNFKDPNTGQAQPLALETMGGGSGQTLAGAISTGTHGGDKSLPGGLADSVLAIHMVGAGGSQFWIEPTSGITDPVLLKEYVVPNIDPKNIIYDTATFDACLVSLGCMGVIYAIVLRVRPQYDLIETTTDTTWELFQTTASTYLNDASTRFLQVAISPYPKTSGTPPGVAGNIGDHLCLVTTRVEGPPSLPLGGLLGRPNYDDEINAIVLRMIDSLDFFCKIAIPGGYIDSLKNSPDEQTAALVQFILDNCGGQWHVLTDFYPRIMFWGWPPTTPPLRGLSYSIMDSRYGHDNTTTTSGAYSIEVFLPATDASGYLHPNLIAFVNDAISLISADTSTVLAGYFSLRFTGPTHAYLGMQLYSPTCAVEIAGVRGVANERKLLIKILQLAYQKYPAALPHWGQILDQDIGAPPSGGAIWPWGYAAWRQVYAKLSNNFVARTFENALSVRWKLTTP